MAVSLRLMRVGKRNRPYYRLCAIDKRKPRGGEYIENLGSYDPKIEDANARVKINRERAEYWLSVGAQPTETVRSFFRKAKIAGLTSSGGAKKPPRKRPPKTGKAAAKNAAKRAKKKAASKKKPKKKESSDT